MTGPIMSTNSVFQPTPQCLRELVLDYLLHNSYIDTARAFAMDSAVVVHADKIREGLVGDVPTETDGVQRMDEDAGPEEQGAAEISEDVLRVVRLRREVKFHILSGRVDEATQLLNTHFPSVLQEGDSDAYPPSRPQDPSASHAKVHYASQLSTKPVHISLNLRILAFIEAARTVPLSYAADPLRASSAAAPDRSSDAFSAHQTALLHRAQRLYATVESLRDVRDRDLYRKELNSVGGLLAYPAPEKSPMAKYMTQERREAVADQVNSAILYHLGQHAASHIELYARQTATVWSTMRDNNMTLPPSSQRPAGVSLPPSAPRETAPPSTKTGNSGKTEKAEAEPIPPFDLRLFLDGP